MNLKLQIDDFPSVPGVYLMKDKSGKIIYVGKAKDLKVRIRSYFSVNKDERYQIEFLMKRVDVIECLVTDNEKEALLLEHSLIQKHKPKYNIFLKDDKSYVSIKINEWHKFPGIWLTRKIVKDGSRYYGPYPSSTSAREAADYITKYFGIRTCQDREFANRSRACLRFDIGRCVAPCVNKVSEGEYGKLIADAKLLLSGKRKEVLKDIKRLMNEAAKELRYEAAAKYRNLTKNINSMLEKQKAIKYTGANGDYIGFYEVQKKAVIYVMIQRDGKLVGSYQYSLNNFAGSVSENIKSFILQYYDRPLEVPLTISLSHKIEDEQPIREILQERNNARVKFLVPQRGEHKKLIDLALRNAKLFMEKLDKKDQDLDVVLKCIQQKLKLNQIPRYIEAVDISNIHGKHAVGAIVAHQNGEPVKNKYRIYNIKTSEEPNDYAMMQEVLTRRLFGKSQDILPDLLLLDGGKGHLNIAVDVLANMGFHDLPCASIAKGKKNEDDDKIFIPERKNPINFKSGSKELLFLMRIRDEAHRFGITRHRMKRTRESICSDLESISGIGDKLRKKLLLHFKSIEKIKSASFEELESIPGITKTIAKAIKTHL